MRVTLDRVDHGRRVALAHIDLIFVTGELYHRRSAIASIDSELVGEARPSQIRRNLLRMDLCDPPGYRAIPVPTLGADTLRAAGIRNVGYGDVADRAVDHGRGICHFSNLVRASPRKRRSSSRGQLPRQRFRRPRNGKLGAERSSTGNVAGRADRPPYDPTSDP